MPKTLLLALAAASALAGAAHAQGSTQLDAKTIDDWRTVTLADGVSIDVPRAVGDQYRPENKADNGLMLFRVGVKDAGEMYCGLDRMIYDKPPLAMNRKRAIDFMTTANPGIFCHGVGMDSHERSAESVTSAQGHPGSRCVGSYTDQHGDQTEGDVIHARVVVAPDAVYVLTCTVSDLDQGRAQTDWQEIWRTRITHLEASLKTP